MNGKAALEDSAEMSGPNGSNIDAVGSPSKNVSTDSSSSLTSSHSKDTSVASSETARKSTMTKTDKLDASKKEVVAKNAEKIQIKTDDGAEPEQPTQASQSVLLSPVSNQTQFTDTSESVVESLPKLKYTRLTKMPRRFFNKDPVSACAFHSKAFIFATHSGLIHICTPDFQPIRTFKAHTTSILSLHTDGEYFASGSMDGTVVIGSLTKPEDITRYDFKRPIYAVALYRQYASTHSFISGGTGGSLLFSTRGWLGQRSDTKLNVELEGPITMIQTMDDLAFWTNDSGIHVTQLTSRSTIMHVPLPPDFPRPEMYWPRAYVIDETRLLIGWVDQLWTLKISKNEDTRSRILSSAASSFMGVNIEQKLVEIERHACLEDVLIAGVSGFGADLLVLNYLKPERGEGRKLVNLPPELLILDQMTLDEQSVDEVGLKDYSGLGLNDYHLYNYLDPSTGEPEWFLVSANDAVMVEKFGPYDQLAWYNSRGRYLEAWELSGTWLDRDQKLDLALKQGNEYVSSDKWTEAGEFLGVALHIDLELDSQEYLDRVSSEWNGWLRIFSDTNHLDFIAKQMPSVPIGSEGILQKYYTDAVLLFLRRGDYSTVIELVQKWDHRLFDVEAVRSAVGQRLSEITNMDMSRLFVDMCVEVDRPEACVDELIKLKDKQVMQFLDEHHLLPSNLDKLGAIVELTADKKDLDTTNIDHLRTELADFLAILVENSHEILPKDLIASLNNAGYDYVSYLYLEQLAQGEQSRLLVTDLEDQMVELYASYNREELSGFLSKHKNYSIEQAIAVCESKRCISELAYLLSKVGQNKKALKLIIDELDDPQKAIEFVESVGDKELWDYFLDYSMDKSRPDFVYALLESAGESIDPIPVVSRIPEGIEIQDLKKALCKITQNVGLDYTIYRRILEIIWKQTVSVSDEYRSIRLRGYCHDALDNRIRSSLQTLVELHGEPSITEAELLGEGQVWPGEASDPSSKIKHASYIKSRMMFRSK